LELTFHTAELRDICEKRSVASAKLGHAAAAELAARLADIVAVDNVAELCAIADVCDHGPVQKWVRIGGFRVIFESAHPLGRDEVRAKVDWRRARRVRIMSIERTDV
jgi:hypothetical protein